MQIMLKIIKKKKKNKNNNSDWNIVEPININNGCRLHNRWQNVCLSANAFELIQGNIFRLFIILNSPRPASFLWIAWYLDNKVRWNKKWGIRSLGESKKTRESYRKPGQGDWRCSRDQTALRYVTRYIPRKKNNYFI